MTIVVADDDGTCVNEHLLAVERVLNGHGLITIRESLNAVEAWLGSLPGNPYANIRQPIVHTLNLAHLMPVSAVWAGPARNHHLNAPPLMLTETRGTTPFRFDLHVGDVGHALAADLLATFPEKQTAAAKAGMPVTEQLSPQATTVTDKKDDPIDAAFDKEQKNEAFAVPSRENDASAPPAAAVRRTSKRLRLAKVAGAATLIAALGCFADTQPARALTVFDPVNYQQNLLSAVRALEQVNNQISQLQNEAQTLLRLDQNLQRLGATLSPDLQRALTEIEARLADGEGLALKLEETEAAYARLFPQEPPADLSSDESFRNAQALGRGLSQFEARRSAAGSDRAEPWPRPAIARKGAHPVRQCLRRA